MKTLLASFLALALLSALTGCKREAPREGGPAEGRSTVTVKGSDTLVILGQRWAEELMKGDASIKIQVTGGGSGTGLAALINGTTDIAMSSRAIKPAEAEQVKRKYGTEPRSFTVARDGITFYVHETNPIESLTLEQLKAIYLGDLTNWKEVGGADEKIVLYSRENSSGTYTFVKERVLDNEDFAAEAQTLPGTAAVVNAVAQETHGIGYGGAAFARGVKELKVRKGDEAIAPSAENILSGAYPLSRDLYFYTRGEPSGAARRYIDFAFSPEGQRLVRAAGYYPVK
ncbi:phosphate ABC transporter substrate-binding protein [Myxococcaceae bacterium GXIMD 01537]